MSSARQRGAGANRPRASATRINAPGLALLALWLCGLLAPAGAAAARKSGEAAAFGHACKFPDWVRFCPTEGLSQRVPSFDGVPLDVDVTLPATGNGPFPV